MALALLLDDALLADPDLAPVRAYLHAARRQGRDDGRAARAARRARGPALRGVHVLARRDARGLAARHDARRRRTRRRSAGSGASGSRCSATAGSPRAGIPRIVPLARGGRRPRAGDDRAAAGSPRLRLRARRPHVPRAARPHRASSPRWSSTRSPRARASGRTSTGATRRRCTSGAARDASTCARSTRIAGFDHDDRFVDPLDDRAAHAPPPGSRATSSVASRRGAPPSRAGPSTATRASSSWSTRASGASARPWRARSGTLVREDETLRFDDVAVLVPPGDAAAYAAHLPAAFREAHDVPHQIVGPSAGGARAHRGGHRAPPRAAARALHARRAAASWPCTRRSSARMDDVDPERWLAWCEALGVVHGADRADHEGTYIDRDILNWDQGLRRLALGAFMAGDASGDGSPVPGGRRRVRAARGRGLRAARRGGVRRAPAFARRRRALRAATPR